MAKRGRKQVKRNRSKLYRDNLRLSKRSTKRDIIERSKNDPKKKNDIKDRYAKVKSRKEKYAIQKIFEEKAVTSARKKPQIIQEYLTVKQGYIRAYQKIGEKVLGSKIKDFFGRVPKRYLLDNMKNLYTSFKIENPTLRCSYSSFTRYRPFYVMPPTVAARETCLCRVHTNIQYLPFALCTTK
nr:unnamed protein product [Callosobruchus analis]